MCEREKEREGEIKGEREGENEPLTRYFEYVHGPLTYWIRRRPPEPEIPGSSPGRVTNMRVVVIKAHKRLRTHENWGDWERETERDS